MTAGAGVVQIRRHDFSLSRRARTVGAGHGGGAGLRVPGDEPVLRGGTDGQRPDGVGVSVAVAVVVVPAPVAAGPDEDGSLVASALADAVEEGLGGHTTGPVHSLAVVVRAPAAKKKQATAL